jgi:hypothetical protein
MKPCIEEDTVRWVPCSSRWVITEKLRYGVSPLSRYATNLLYNKAWQEPSMLKMQCNLVIDL